jgi:hypothetical protein
VLYAAPEAMADVAFDPVPVGADSPWEEILVENADSQPLAFEPAVLGGPDAAGFVIVADDCDDAPLQPGEICAVTILFRPQRVGPHSARLDIRIDGEPEPLSVQLSGEGIPWLRFTPAALDFATLRRTVSQPQDVVVENVSGRTMNPLLPMLDRSGDFRIVADTCRAAKLAPGATCRVSVTFANGLPAGSVSEALLNFVSGPNSTLTGWNVVASVALRGTTLAQSATTVPSGDTPDISARLGRRLRAALAPLRGGNQGRVALLRSGLVVRGIVSPVPGVLGLEVWARGSKRTPATLVAVRWRLAAQADKPARIKARLTRAGRRLLRRGRPLVLEIELTMTAQADKLVSSAERVLRLGRAPGPAVP